MPRQGSSAWEVLSREALFRLGPSPAGSQRLHCVLSPTLLVQCSFVLQYSIFLTNFSQGSRNRTAEAVPSHAQAGTKHEGTKLKVCGVCSAALLTLRMLGMLVKAVP